MTKPLILLTNDDGIASPGLAALAQALEPLGDVHVYAPDREQSAVSHGISLHRPLRIQELRPHWHMIDGTPTDCVMLAVHDQLHRRPDLVVSGINNGANVGDDVYYSGTVAGAYEGMLLGLPSIAVSNVNFTPEHLDTSAQVAHAIARHAIEQGIPKDTLLNVNVPDIPFDKLRGVAITRMGRGRYEVEIVGRTDPRGGEYFWIGGSRPTNTSQKGTDFEAIADSKVSITPLLRDKTNLDALDLLQSREIQLG